MRIPTRTTAGKVRDALKSLDENKFAVGVLKDALKDWLVLYALPRDYEYPRGSFEKILEADGLYVFYLQQWAKYKDQAGMPRLKMEHDIKLHTGEEIPNCYPNSTSWQSMIPALNPLRGKHNRWSDSEVEYIRLSKRSSYNWDFKKKEWK